MLIAEHFLLITIDPTTGLPAWPRRSQRAEPLVAAALLLELAALRRLSLREARLHADATLPLSNQLLNEALHEVALRPVSARSALRQVERRLGRVTQKLMESLFQRDILHRTANWLPWRRVRYPLRSAQARNEAILHLQRAASESDDLHGLALLMLVDVTGLLPAHFKAREHEAAMHRLLALGPIDAQRDEPRKVLAAVRAALLAE